MVNLQDPAIPCMQDYNAANQVDLPPPPAATTSGAAAPAGGYDALAVGAWRTAQADAAAGPMARAVAASAAARAAVPPPTQATPFAPGERIDIAGLRARGWWSDDGPQYIDTSDAANSVKGSYTFDATIPLSALQQDGGVLKIPRANMSGAFEPTSYTPTDSSRAAVLEAELSNVRFSVVSSSGTPFVGYPNVGVSISTIPQTAARIRITGQDAASDMAFAHVVVTPSDTPQFFNLGVVSNGIEHEQALKSLGMTNMEELGRDLRGKYYPPPDEGVPVVTVRLPSKTAAALLMSQEALGHMYKQDDLVDQDANIRPTGLTSEIRHVEAIHAQLSNPAFNERLVDLSSCSIKLARTDGKAFTDSSMFSDWSLPADGEAGARGGFKPDFVGRARDAMKMGVLRISGVVTQTVVFPGTVKEGQE